MPRRRRSAAGPNKRTVKLIVTVIVLIVAALAAVWQRYFREKVPDAKGRPMAYAGLPRASGWGSVDILENPGFVIGYSDARKNPRWVAYRLYRLDDSPDLPRPGNFQRDERTSAGVTEEDYKNSGYDRGHLAPNDAIGDCYGEEAQKATFLMSNVCPQKHNFNSGIWERLEALAKERLAVNCVEVWVTTGPIFGAKPKRLKKSGIEVPDRFYKIFLDELPPGSAPAPAPGSGPGSAPTTNPATPALRKLRVLAFDIPQTARESDSLDRYLTSVDAIEAATGLDFFRDLEDQQEAELEAKVAPAVW
jgi:endonuclease G